MEVPTTDPPFGHHAPSGLMQRLIGVSRVCSTGWAAKRLAFALRAVGLKMLRGRPLDVESLGLRMRLYPANNVAEKNLLFTPQFFDAAERDFLTTRLAGDCIFIDVGANVGGYAMFVAARAGPKSRVLAIEPQPEMFERLLFNIGQNPFVNIKALACAVADQDGEVTLFVDAANKGETSMRIVNAAGNGSQIRVPAKTLATIVAEEGYERIDAIKIDVEGAEDLVLEPFFRDADRRLWPGVMLIEHSPSIWAIDLPELLRERGYRAILRTRTNIIYERVS